MKPVLLQISDITFWPCLAIFALAAVGVGLWLAVLRRRGGYTRDHLVTGLALLGMTALFLVILARVGQFRVNAYGALLMLGFVVALFTGMRLARRRNVPTDRLLDLGLVILISSVVGARVMYMLITPDAGSFIDLGSALSEGIGGLSFFGGLIGGIIGTIVYVRVTKLNFWRVADTFAPGLAIGYAITRIGCFLNGCCYGQHTDLPWAVTFPALLPFRAAAIPDVHPTQLYASLMGLAMFGILLLLSRGNSLGRAGRLFLVFLVLEGVERFVMEIFRQPDPRYTGGPTEAQLFSIGLIILGIVGWFVLPRYPAVATAPAAVAQQETAAAK